MIGTRVGWRIAHGGEVQTPTPGDGEDSCEESDPATPRALPADLVPFLHDSGNSESTVTRPRLGAFRL